MAYFKPKFEYKNDGELERDLQVWLESNRPSITTGTVGKQWIYIHKGTASKDEKGQEDAILLQRAAMDGYSCIKNWKQSLSHRVTKSDKNQFVQRLKQIAIEYKQCSGKWMFFVKPECIDQVWSIVCKATVRGELGPSCKVAPFNPRKDPNESILICIYLRNFTDAVEARRILVNLRRRLLEYYHNNFTLLKEKIRLPVAIKPDLYTDIGLYSAQLKQLRLQKTNTFSPWFHRDILEKEWKTFKTNSANRSKRHRSPITITNHHAQYVSLLYICIYCVVVLAYLLLLILTRSTDQPSNKRQRFTKDSSSSRSSEEDLNQLSVQLHNNYMSCLLALSESLSPVEYLEGISLLNRVISNVIDHPKEPKFRRINLKSKTISKYVNASPAFMRFLQLAGFERKDQKLISGQNNAVSIALSAREVLNAANFHIQSSTFANEHSLPQTSTSASSSVTTSKSIRHTTTSEHKTPSPVKFAVGFYLLRTSGLPAKANVHSLSLTDIIQVSFSFSLVCSRFVISAEHFLV